CAGYRLGNWPRVHRVIAAFLAGPFAKLAVDAGWTELELFGVHPDVGVARPNACGALLTNAYGSPVTQVTPQLIRFANGLAVYKAKLSVGNSVAVWDYREPGCPRTTTTRADADLRKRHGLSRRGGRDLSNHAPPGAVGCKKRMGCFCTSASSAAGLVLTVMASACARASSAAGIAASIGRKHMNHEFIPWLDTNLHSSWRPAVSVRGRQRPRQNSFRIITNR